MVAFAPEYLKQVADPRPELMPFAARLRELRIAKGLTQQGMAEACGWAKQPSYSPYESASKEPTLTVLLKFCAALGVGLAAFDKPAVEDFTPSTRGRPPRALSHDDED